MLDYTLFIAQDSQSSLLLGLPRAAGTAETARQSTIRSSDLQASIQGRRPNLFKTNNAMPVGPESRLLLHISDDATRFWGVQLSPEQKQRLQ